MCSGDAKLCGLIGLVLGSLGAPYVPVAAAGGILLGGLVGIILLAAGHSGANARTRLSELGRQIQSLNESIHNSRARLRAAQVAAAEDRTSSGDVADEHRRARRQDQLE